jgi:diguanylate cyclase (GGDEF)-like protein
MTVEAPMLLRQALRGFVLVDTALRADSVRPDPVRPDPVRPDSGQPDPVRADERNRLDEELTALVAAVYASHDGLAERVLAFERAATEAGDERNALLGRLVRADIDNRNGRWAEGLQTAYAMLHDGADRVVVAHAHAVLAGGLWRLGDNAEAVEHAFQADRLLTEADPLCLRVDHALILSIQVNDQRMAKSSEAEYRWAQDLAEELGESDMIVANLNNWAWGLYQNGDIPAALALADRMFAVSESSGRLLNTNCVDTIARILVADGQSERAAAILETALVEAPSTDSDGIPSCMIAMAEIKRSAGDLAAAIELLERCRRTTLSNKLAEMDAHALRLLADCHAESGDFESAYREMVEFHDAWTRRRSEQSEALTLVTKARFAVDEAKRNSEHFRKLAERDPLTGLWNRRRCEAHLAARLAAPTGSFSVAILDLDHFKQINDSYSHEVGDDVLRQVASLLRQVAEPVGRTGRHGGEEFVVYLDADRRNAVDLCERLRVAIASHDWSSLAPGLHVTTSIGVTELRPADDSRSVLARADSHLYEAKDAGRNQVIAD